MIEELCLCPSSKPEIWSTSEMRVCGSQQSSYVRMPLPGRTGFAQKTDRKSGGIASTYDQELLLRRCRNRRRNRISLFLALRRVPGVLQVDSKTTSCDMMCLVLSEALCGSVPFCVHLCCSSVLLLCYILMFYWYVSYAQLCIIIMIYHHFILCV